jgi:hypothetical protein
MELIYQKQTYKKQVAWFKQVVRRKDKIARTAGPKTKGEDYTKWHENTASWNIKSIFFLGVPEQ